MDPFDFPIFFTLLDRVRTVIVEDHSLLREVIRKVCDLIEGIEVVGEADSGSSATAHIINRCPDLVLLDLELPDFDGLEVLRRVRKAGIFSRFLVLSSHCSPYVVHCLKCAKIDGFLDKRSQTIEVVRNALEGLKRGSKVFCDSYLTVLENQRREPFSFDKVLTEQQMIVLKLVAGCLDDGAIARNLRISARTVEAHRMKIMHKLGLHTRTELVSYATRQGFMFGNTPA